MILTQLEGLEALDSQGGGNSPEFTALNTSWS